MKHELSKDCECRPVVEDYREKAGKPKGRDWLQKLFVKPPNRRNGVDIVDGHKAIDWLFDEREQLLVKTITLSNEATQLQAKLTEAERLNKVALNVMKLTFAKRHMDGSTVCCKTNNDEHSSHCQLNNAIKELEALK